METVGIPGGLVPENNSNTNDDEHRDSDDQLDV